MLTQSPGGLRLAGVKLDPRALRALLRMPLTEFRDNTVDCADLGCHALLDLEDEVANLRSVDQLPEVFDRFFLQGLTRRSSGRPRDRTTGPADPRYARCATDPEVGARAPPRCPHPRTTFRCAHGHDTQAIRARRAFQA